MNVTLRFAAPVFLAVAASATRCKPAVALTPQGGADLYESCKACHGSKGEGQQWLAAPPIAGLPNWYINATLKKFRTGLRGAHPDDYEGLRMRPMSRQMANDYEVDTVTRF